MSNRSEIQLLMNSDLAKEIREWLTEGLLLYFTIWGFNVSIWETRPFIVITKIKQ